VYSPYTKNLYAGSALGVVTEIHVHTGKVGRVIPFGFKDAHGTAHLAVSPDDKTLYAFGADPARTVTTVTPINLVTGKASPPVRGRRRSCSPRTARRRTS
jgi:DNA-binding beta-propeller fold protein YncE